MSLQEPDDVFSVPEDIDGDEADKKSDGESTIEDLRILEAVLFASEELMTATQIKAILPGNLDSRKIRAMVEKINVQLQKERHPFEIVEIGGGYQFRTITYYHPWVRQIFKEKAVKKLSIQALECLAIIAYKQPISKADIEAIRGVVSDGAMKTLLEKRFITVSGRSDKPGRPLLYTTTQTFLKYFGLNKTEDLPRIEEFEAIAKEKLDDLSIDELEESESSVEEAINGEVENDSDKKEDIPKKGTEESSLFEVDVTASVDSPDKESEKEVKSVKHDEPVPPENKLTKDINAKVSSERVSDEHKAGKRVEKDTTVAPEKSPHEEKGPTEVESEIVEEKKAVKTADGIDDGSVAEVPPGTAEFEVTVDKKNADISTGGLKGIQEPELASEMLRGETAFDLAAIRIDDPVLPIPSSADKKEKKLKTPGKEKSDKTSASPKVNESVPPATDLFEVNVATRNKEVADNVKEEGGVDFEVSVQENSNETSTTEKDVSPQMDETADAEDFEVLSEQDSKEIDGDEPVTRFAETVKTDAIIDEDDGEFTETDSSIFEVTTVPDKSEPEKKQEEEEIFEVNGALSTTADNDKPVAAFSDEDHETLGGALLETAAIKPDKIKKKATKKRGATKGKSAVVKTPRKKKNTPEKKDRKSDKGERDS